MHCVVSTMDTVCPRSSEWLPHADTYHFQNLFLFLAIFKFNLQIFPNWHPPFLSVSLKSQISAFPIGVYNTLTSAFSIGVFLLSYYFELLLFHRSPFIPPSLLEYIFFNKSLQHFLLCNSVGSFKYRLRHCRDPASIFDKLAGRIALLIQ